MKPLKKNSKSKLKKPIIILFAVFIGLMISGVIGMEYFDPVFTEDQKLTMAIQDQYPTYQSLKDALDSGEFDHADLSNELKGYMMFKGTEFEFNIDKGIEGFEP
jgi:hypothetical protein